jgi:hypothetical protein
MSEIAADHRYLRETDTDGQRYIRLRKDFKHHTQQNLKRAAVRARIPGYSREARLQI